MYSMTRAKDLCTDQDTEHLSWKVLKPQNSLDYFSTFPPREDLSYCNGSDSELAGYPVQHSDVCN